MNFLCTNAARAKKSFQYLHACWKRKPRILKAKSIRRLFGRGGKGEGRMKNNDLYLGIGVGMAAGVISGLLMRPKRKNVKSAVAQIIGDMADSVPKNMGW